MTAVLAHKTYSLLPVPHVRSTCVDNVVEREGGPSVTQVWPRRASRATKKKRVPPLAQAPVLTST